MNANSCKNIDISKVSNLGKIKSEINQMTLEELQQMQKDYSEILKIIKRRISDIKPKAKQPVTATMDKKEGQASDSLQSREDINRIVKYFLDKDDITTAALLIFGFNNGNRFGDIHKLTTESILNSDGRIKSSIVIEEEKNRFVRTLYFNEAVQKALKLLVNALKKDRISFLFTSNCNNKQYSELWYSNGKFFDKKLLQKEKIRLPRLAIKVKLQKPISRTAVNDKIQKACKELDIVGHFGTHTMRKTFCDIVADENTELFFKKMAGVMVTCSMVGHKDSSTTEKFYLKLSEQERKEVQMSLNLGLEALNAYLSEHSEI